MKIWIVIPGMAYEGHCGDSAEAFASQEGSDAAKARMEAATLGSTYPHAYKEGDLGFDQKHWNVVDVFELEVQP